MPSILQQIQELIDFPRKSLAVELKDRFDPDSPEGYPKLVRGFIAMRNRGSGGYILVGIDYQTTTPNFGGAPADVGAAFHVDKIKRLVNRHSSERLEIHVHFPERDGQVYPVLEVDAGAETLVAARRPCRSPG